MRDLWANEGRIDIKRMSYRASLVLKAVSMKMFEHGEQGERGVGDRGERKGGSGVAICH